MLCWLRWLFWHARPSTLISGCPAVSSFTLMKNSRGQPTGVLCRCLAPQLTQQLPSCCITAAAFCCIAAAAALVVCSLHDSSCEASQCLNRRSSSSALLSVCTCAWPVLPSCHAVLRCAALHLTPAAPSSHQLAPSACAQGSLAQQLRQGAQQAAHCVLVSLTKQQQARVPAVWRWA